MNQELAGNNSRARKDVESRKDLEQLLEAFYKKAFSDDLIGHFFTQVVPLDLKTHLPLITDFWEAVVFDTQNYWKNVMEIHQHIGNRSAISKQHLDRWVQLFTETIDEHFSGVKVMKQRATSVATLMDIRFNYKPSITKL